jgi:hypothetical protein
MSYNAQKNEMNSYRNYAQKISKYYNYSFII